ncbi:hypothetical protein Halhy_4906 [Haliscomenobacter hydrossis DSM 1100]|uniref:Uncharacterized protein n=1 Tax=Haliscomenobacter hydrossis (strain ATCC 27775 / DSM 1100 / LMG 10767 / O) TaxID=760192 RepID=F4L026_HALH1|nr:hypothetical protein Halhy_4906 [Haliscomenobacter hydrossis DSM 1100]
MKNPEIIRLFSIYSNYFRIYGFYFLHDLIIYLIISILLNTYLLARSLIS